jgi:hypothetical protein
VRDVFRIVGDPVRAAGSPAALAVATEIEGVRAESRTEMRHHEVPPPGMRRSPVQQHHRRAAAAVIDNVEAQARSRDEPIDQS